jgi:hypothetical protein
MEIKKSHGKRKFTPLIVLLMTKHIISDITYRSKQCFNTVELYLLWTLIFVVHFVKLHVFTFWLPCCDMGHDFGTKMMFSSSLLLFVFLGGKSMVFAFINVYVCPTRFPCQINVCVVNTGALERIFHLLKNLY